MDVLRVLVVWSGSLSVYAITSTLRVYHDAVEGIVSETRLLYIWGGDILLLPYVKELLQDADRAGEYYIPPKDLNPDYDSMYAKIVASREETLWARFLSHQSPSSRLRLSYIP